MENHIAANNCYHLSGVIQDMLSDHARLTAVKDTWTRQDIQLSNGLRLCNYTRFGEALHENVPMSSQAALFIPEGVSELVDTITTPLASIVINGKTYFSGFRIEILSAGHSHTQFIVEHACPEKELIGPGYLNKGYEGPARAGMVMLVETGEKIKGKVTISTGTAWVEQNLGI